MDVIIKSGYQLKCLNILMDNHTHSLSNFIIFKLKLTEPFVWVHFTAFQNQKRKKNRTNSVNICSMPFRKRRTLLVDLLEVKKSMIAHQCVPLSKCFLVCQQFGLNEIKDGQSMKYAIVSIPVNSHSQTHYVCICVVSECVSFFFSSFLIKRTINATTMLTSSHHQL